MKAWRSGWRLAVLVFGFALLVLLVMDFNTRMAELRRLTAERERVSAQVTSLVNTQSALQTQVAQATSEAAVLYWAYTYEHMVEEGDTLIVPIQQPGTAPTPVPSPTPEVEVIENWQVWMSLFIDHQP
jgi:ABC-type multidrug transport system fused ATPase/permease subunit